MKHLARLLLLVWALVLPLSAQTQTDTEDEDRGYLQALLEDNLSGAGRSVRITGFAGALSSVATIEELTIADDAGVWITVRGIELDWSRAALLRGRVEVNTLTADEILLPRLPSADTTTEELPDPESKPFSLPELPVSIRIDELAIDRVELGEAVMGVAASLSATGSAELADGDGTASLTVERLDAAAGALSFTGSFANETGELALDLTLNEGPGGIAATLLALPDSPEIALTLQGSGPLDDFAADLALATDGTDRLTGSVSLTALDDPANPGRSFRATLGGDIRPLMQPDHRAFFGPDLSLALAGQQFASGRLTLDTLDFSTDALTLSGQLALGADKWPETIELTGRIVSQTGGPVLLALPGADTRVDGVDLDVQYDAAAGDTWRAALAIDQLARPDISLANATLDGSGTLSRGDGTAVGQMTGDLTITASDLVAADPALARALGDAIDGVIRFDWQQGRPFNMPQIRLGGDDYGLDGSLSIGGLETDISPDITGDVQVTASDISRFSGLAGRDLGGSIDLRVIGTTAPLDGAFDATVQGTARDIVTGIAEADGLLNGQTTLSIDAARGETGIILRDFTLSAPGARAEASGTLSSTATRANFDITLPDTSLVLPELQGQTQITGDVRQTGNSYAFDARASAPGGVLFDGTATIALVEGALSRVSGSGNLNADNLSLYSGLARRDLGGSVSLTGSGQFNALDQTFAADLTGTTTDLRADIPQLDRLLDGRADITLDAERTATGIELRTLELTAPRITATGLGTLRDTNSSAQFDVTLRDLGDVLGDLSGAAALKATLTQNGDQWDIKADGTGPGGVALDALAQLTYTFDDIARITQGTLGAISGSGTFRADDIAPYAPLAQRDLSGAVSVTGSGSYDPTDQSFDADVSGTADDLRVGIEQADNLLAGSSSFTVDAGRDDNGLLVRTLRFDGQQITATGEGILRDAASAARFDVVLVDLGDVLNGLSGGARLNGSLDQTGDNWALDATASGPGGASLDGQATVTYADGVLGQIRGQGQLSVDSLAPYGAIANRPLAGAVTLSGTGGFDPRDTTYFANLTGTTTNVRTGIDAVDKLTAGRGTIRVDLNRTDDGVLTVTTLDVATPQITADASGSLGPSDSTLRYDVTLRDLGLFVAGFNGAANARGTATTTGGDYRIDADLTAPGGTNASVSGTVAPDASRANIGLTGSAPLALGNTFTEPNLLDGIARFDLRLNGPLALDAVSGTISTDSAEFVLAGQPLNLTNIRANIGLSGGRAQLDVQSDVSSGGTLSVTGPVTLAAPFNGDLAIVLRSVGLVEPGLVETQLNGQLALQGALLRDARLSGRVDFEDVEVRIPDTGLGATGLDFELKHVNEPAPVRATRKRAGLIADPAASGGGSSPRIAYPLDLLINAPSRIFIRGRGLDAELGGQLRLRGTTANVIPQGEFSLIRGRLDILGQRLDLTTATISLQGSFDPFISVAAETNRAETTIRIAIEGPVSDPEVTITSSPERPEEEVLALLLFGRDVTQISAFQAVRLAAAVNTLVGRGGTGIVDRLRMGFGLDDFDVQTADDGSTELRFGKYIGENLYTDVTVNSGGSTEINLNLDVTSSVTARGSVGSDGNTSLGVFFEKDY